MKKAKMKNKEWMADEILQMMDQRRFMKNKEKYKELDRKIKKEVRAAKEEWMKGKCKEIEELQDKHDHANVYRRIREVTDKRKQKITAFLLDSDGNLAVEVEERLAIWKAYIEELFRDERGGKPDMDCVTGPSILESEVRRALERSTDGKATGPDDVPVEILKIMGDASIKKTDRAVQCHLCLGDHPRRLAAVNLYDVAKETGCEDMRRVPYHQPDESCPQALSEDHPCQNLQEVRREHQ